MVFGAVHRLLMAARDARGVVLVVDDAHLADDGTVEACGQLARAHGAVPLLVVAAYWVEGARPSLSQGVAGLERAGRAVTVDLGPMDRREIASLVAAAGAPAGGEGPEAALVEMAQGNPFFALELARGAAARGAGARRGAGVPRSVWDAVTARSLDFDEATMGMLRRLAVAGDDLDTAGVLALTGMPEADAVALLDAGLDAGRSWSRAAGTGSGTTSCGSRWPSRCRPTTASRCTGTPPAVWRRATPLPGLEGDSCPCPHWGYMLSGRLLMRVPGGDRTYGAGQAFSWGPGHAPFAHTDCSYVGFSPTEEFAHVLAHITREG